MKNLIIADIDECCVDSSARLPYYLAGEMGMYHNSIQTDKPIPQGCVVYRQFLDNKNFKVLFVTSRMVTQFAETFKQLREFVSPNIQEDQLLMRPTELKSDVYPAHIMKPMMVKAAGYNISDIFLAFDDVPEIINEWRRLGVVAYQTAPGAH